MKRKPAPSTIAKAGRLTLLRDNPNAQTEDPLLGCWLCGLPAFHMRRLRECDDNDKPRPGDDALIYVGAEHDACNLLLEEHPRLYLDEQGAPGQFGICAPCDSRQGLTCASPFLKKNGGPGLTVTVDHLPGIVSRSSRGKCERSSRLAVKCSRRAIGGKAEP